MLPAECLENVVLGVIEIRFEIQTRIALLIRNIGLPEVDSIPFSAELKEDAFWECGCKRQCFQEVRQNEI